MAVDLRGMQSAVSNMVLNAIYRRTEHQKAQRGVIRGNNVVIGNRVMSYTPAVDVYFGDGDNVWCLVPDSGRTAVVIGV